MQITRADVSVGQPTEASGWHVGESAQSLGGGREVDADVVQIAAWQEETDHDRSPFFQLVVATSAVLSHRVRATTPSHLVRRSTVAARGPIEEWLLRTTMPVIRDVRQSRRR
jgi:hypothetical protein